MRRIYSVLECRSRLSPIAASTTMLTTMRPMTNSATNAAQTKVSPLDIHRRVDRPQPDARQDGELRPVFRRRVGRAPEL